MPLSTGTRIGSYEIVTAIGSGGMGEVYSARDTRLGRDVALKILPALFANDPERLARFEREAKTLASLNHPNIAQIYGLEESGEHPALVMELVPGPTLDQVLSGTGHSALGTSERKALPVSDALAIARQIADALEAAHDAGIIHRDLKPANIKVRDDGTVKVLDFGLAKAIEPERSSSELMNSPTITSPVTELGVILGTAGYMSPEQARGRAVDKRADMWAFGVVLYEMLTGGQLFGGDTVTDVIAAVVTREPDWQKLPPDVPPAIQRLLRRCLEKDRKLRLRDAGDARLEINDALGGSTESRETPSAVPAPSSTRTVAIAAGASIVVGLLAAAAVWQLQRPALATISRFSIVPPLHEPLQIETNHPDLVISRDGSRLVYWNNVNQVHRFVIRSFDRFDGAVLDKLGLNARGPILSPDGGWIAFQTGGTSGQGNVLIKSALTGGTPLTVCPVDGNLRGGTWTADDQIVFATAARATGLHLVRAAGGTAEVLTRPKSDQNESDHRWPHVLPDGKHVLFEISRTTGSSDIGLLSLATREWKVIQTGGTSPRYVPTGHIVYTASGTLRAVGFDLQQLEVTTEPVPVLEGVLEKESGAADFSISDNGTLAYMPGSAGPQLLRFVWVDRKGVTTPTGVELANLGSPRLSPDARRVATGIGDPTIDTAVWTYDFQTETVSRVTPPGITAGYVVWTPDRRHITFWGPNGPAGSGIYRMAASGTGAPELLVKRDTQARPGAWSADSKQLLFSEFADTGADIFLLTLGESPTVKLLVGGSGYQGSPALSPNSRWLAHTSDESGRSQVYVRPFPNVNDDRAMVSSGVGQFPEWSANGRELFFVDPSADGLFVVAMDPERGQPAGKAVKVAPLPDSVLRNRSFSVSADGQKFLFTARSDAVGPRLNEFRIVTNWFEELKSKMAAARRKS